MGLVVDLAAFSAASMESGRLRGPLEDVGLLCCQLRPLAVEELLVGEALPLGCLASLSNGDSFSLVGEEEKEPRAYMGSSSGSSLVLCGLAGGSRMGEESKVRRSGAWVTGRCADDGGVLTGEDFWGEMDLARSAKEQCQPAVCREDKVTGVGGADGMVLSLARPKRFGLGPRATNVGRAATARGGGGASWIKQPGDRGEERGEGGTHLHDEPVVLSCPAGSSLPVRGSALRPPRHGGRPALEFATGTWTRPQTWLSDGG